MFDKDKLRPLAEAARQENLRYRLTGSSDSSYGCELFRLALFGSDPEEAEEAWHSIVDIYKPNLYGWLSRHPWEDCITYREDIVQETFELFWRQHKKQSLQVDSLPQILTYLRRCLHTAVMLHKRKVEHDPPPHICLGHA